MKEIKINNNIEEDHVPLYNPEGKLVGIIENELALMMFVFKSWKTN